MVTPLIAAKAYASVQGAGVSGIGGGEAAGQPDFSKFLTSALNDAVSSSRTAETQMASQVAGKADLVSVATSISAAEASLETVMAVRDQVISAYQEIMRMPI